MLRTGFWVIAHWRGIPIRVHWATPLGAFLFGRFEFVPGFWAGFFLLILFHELGHAFVVRLAKAKVHSVDILPIGGLCTWSGNVTPIQRACIAWGGVWAQMLVFAVASIVLTVTGAPTNKASAQLAHAFTGANLWMMAINLFPARPLDGAEAWPLFPMLWKRFRQGQHVTRVQKTKPAAAETDESKYAFAAELEEDETSPEAKAIVDGLFKELAKTPKKDATDVG